MALAILVPHRQIWFSESVPKILNAPTDGSWKTTWCWPILIDLAPTGVHKSAGCCFLQHHSSTFRFWIWHQQTLWGENDPWQCWDQLYHMQCHDRLLYPSRPVATCFRCAAWMNLDCRITRSPVCVEDFWDSTWFSNRSIGFNLRGTTWFSNLDKFGYQSGHLAHLLRFSLQKELRIQTDAFTYTSVASASGKSGSSTTSWLNISAVWGLHFHLVTTLIINIILSNY